MKNNFKYFVLIIFVLAYFGAVFGAQDSALVKWKNNNSWSNDSIAITEDNAIEIHRDVSDLWFSTRKYNAPSFFISLVKHHGFSLIVGNFTKKIFQDFPEIKKVRYVFKININEFASQDVAKLRINKETYESAQFKALSALVNSNPKEFVDALSAKLDGIWINPDLEKE